MTLISAGTMVLDGRVCRPGWLEFAAGRVVACGAGAPPRPVDAEFPDAVVVPGFVDMHVHGGGGASYTDGVEAEVSRAAAFHLRHGTTTTVASLVTASPSELLGTVRVLSEQVGNGTLAGIHLEGPWLSSARCGAHDATQLRDPDPGEIAAVLAAGNGAIRMVTLAPELEGGVEAVRRLVDGGVVVAIGHTDATYEQTTRALAAGATVGTHIFNAMRPLHHREPGPALALLEDPRVTVEVVADGVHVHPALVRQVMEVAGPERVSLITDAMSAAGMTDGFYRLGTLEVEVEQQVARVRGTSTVAGSTATMDELFRTALRMRGGIASDSALVAAVDMTSTTPARALGLADVGALRVGRRADLVVLDSNGSVLDVLLGGYWRLRSTV